MPSFSANSGQRRTASMTRSTIWLARTLLTSAYLASVALKGEEDDKEVGTCVRNPCGVPGWVWDGSELIVDRDHQHTYE